MFVCEKLVFLELHKTGGSHIRKLLAEVVGGGKEGKHNRLNPAYKDRFIVGSVRNPWDWYVSLWAFGCGGKGSVHLQCIDGPNVYYYRHNLRDEMGISGLGLANIYKQYRHDKNKDRDFWAYCYEDAEDPKRFQAWLARILDPKYALDLREGYGFSPLAQHTGLLGYRYLKLFTDLDGEIYRDAKLADPNNVEKAVAAHMHTDFIIRNEHMEEDFTACLQAAKIEVTEQQQAIIQAGRDSKTNASKRREMAYYFNQESIDLIAEKEALLISKHGYQPPMVP